MNSPSKSYAAAYPVLLLTSCSIAFASYFGSYMRIPVVPLFAGSLGASTAQVGAINAAFLLMCGALSFPLGLLSDRWGKKPLVVTGLLISGGTSILLWFSQTPLQLIGIYLLFGMGLAAIGPTLMSYVADISPATHLGRSYGWYTTAIYSGMSLGPAVGGFLAQWWGFRALFLIAGAFTLVLVGLTAILLPEIRRAPADGTPRVKRGSATHGIWQNRPLLGCWLVTLGGCFAQGMFLTFAPLHAAESGLSLAQIGLLFTAQAVVNALSRLPFGRLSDDRLSGRGALAALGFILYAASLAGFGLTRGFTGLLIASLASGVSMGLAFTPLGALIAETVPPESRGLAMGGYNTCIYLGMMLSSGLMGGVLEWTGFGLGFTLTALVAVAAAGVFYWMIKDFAGNPARANDHFPVDTKR